MLQDQFRWRFSKVSWQKGFRGKGKSKIAYLRIFKRLIIILSIYLVAVDYYYCCNEAINCWPLKFQIISTAVHEDGCELSLTVNFALRGNKDPFIGDKMGSSRDYLSTYTEGRKSSLSRYPSQDSLGEWKVFRNNKI